MRESVIDTQALKDLLAKVTPGEWVMEIEAEPKEDYPEIYVCSDKTVCDATVVAKMGWATMLPNGQAIPNATLIALAPSLAAEVVRLRVALEGIAQSADDDDGWTSDGHERCTEAASQSLYTPAKNNPPPAHFPVAPIAYLCDKESTEKGTRHDHHRSKRPLHGSIQWP